MGMVKTKNAFFPLPFTIRYAPFHGIIICHSCKEDLKVNVNPDIAAKSLAHINVRSGSIIVIIDVKNILWFCIFNWAKDGRHFLFVTFTSFGMCPAVCDFWPDTKSYV